jgi:hypothetical protein
MNVNEKTTIKLPIAYFWAFACIISSGTAFIVGVYAESKTIPGRMDKIEKEVVAIKKENEAKSKNDLVNCLILQQIQNVVLAPNYRIEQKCVSNEANQ